MRRSDALRATALALAAFAAASAGCAPQQPPARRHVHVHRAARAVPSSQETRRPAPAAVPETPLYVAWGDHTVETRLAEIGARARSRWAPYFRHAGVAYPPQSVVLVTLKRERRVEIYAGPSPYELARIRTIDVTAASGGPGPKLREGDRQVPEGIYSLASLNPNSAYHVALRIAYPNDFDLRMGLRDRRRRLGGDIMIHGGDRSIGCVAVGDLNAEDLFVIAADAGIENVTALFAPRDFRRTGETEPMPGQPAWVRELYADIDRRLRSLPGSAPIVSSDAASEPDFVAR